MKSIDHKILIGPILIIFLLFQIGAIATFYFIYNRASLNLSETNLINHIIQTWACVGAFTTATIVIHSYVITNRTFILSQKPNLYMFVQALKVKRTEQDNDLVYRTIIHYQNKSNNPFYDLTIHVKVSIDKHTVNMDDLFRPHMYMAATDQRQRYFITEDEFKKRGVDLNIAMKNQSDIILSLQYSFTFDNQKETISVQEYIWDKNGMGWSIF